MIAVRAGAAGKGSGWRLLLLPFFYAAVGPALGLLLVIVFSGVLFLVSGASGQVPSLTQLLASAGGMLAFAYLFGLLPAFATGVATALAAWLTARQWVMMLVATLFGGGATFVLFHDAPASPRFLGAMAAIGAVGGLLSALVARVAGLLSKAHPPAEPGESR